MRRTPDLHLPVPHTPDGHPMTRKDADPMRDRWCVLCGVPARECSAEQHRDRLAAAREDTMGTEPDNGIRLFRSELRSIAAGLLNLRTHLDDDPHDEELRRVAVRLGELANGAAPRASQAATAANGAGDDAGAAHDPHKPAAASTEPRVHYEVEAYTDGWSIPIHRTDHLDDARDLDSLPEPHWTRIVRVTREVVVS